VSLALRRALGALGGACGSLPLLPIARGFAQRVAGPPRLPGAELAAGDIKAGTWAELAILILVVPAAAFFFGRLLPDFIRVCGGFAVALPGFVSVAGFAAWRLGARPIVSVSLSAGASLLAAAVSIGAPFLLGRRAVGGRPVERPIREEPEPAPARPWTIALVLLAVFAAAWRLWGPAEGPVELFEEGHFLTPVSVYLAGGAPFRDTYPVHGWGSDGGVDAAAARIFGNTVDVVRARRAIWQALGVCALALAAWALFRRPLWSVLAFFLALCLCPYPSERQAPAFAGLAVLVAAARDGRRRAWLAAGALSAAVLFYALEFGVFLLAAGALTLGTCAVLERCSREIFEDALAFAGGALLGASPFLAILAARGALVPFLHVSFVELPATVVDVWGLPASTVVTLFRNETASGIARSLLRLKEASWLFHAAVLALAAAVLLFRSVRPSWSRTDRAALGATWFAVLAMRGALGRADFGHLVMYGVFVALPAAWLLFRAVHAAHARWLLALALAVTLAVAVRPVWLATAIRSNLSRAPQCERRFGDLGNVPCDQVEELEGLRAWMDREIPAGQTFFDFGNEPALYFLMERRPPVRFPAVPFYESEAAQREVIAALERERPPVAILSSGDWHDVFDDVPSRTRTPLVAAYLDRHYAPAERLGTRTLALRRPEP
jgi:hypothetical protein